MISKIIEEIRQTDLNNYIGGAFHPPVTGEYLDLIDPASGQQFSRVANSGKQDVEIAMDTAKKAYPSWAATSPEERSELMLRIADKIDENLEVLAQAESLDNGKPVSLSRRVDIPRASANFRFFAKAITQFSSESHEMPDAINFTLRQPLGVVVAISPWNLPLYLFTWKIAPALAAGNAVIAKPSEVTPLTAYCLSKICEEVGLPKGVLNVIHGEGGRIGPFLSDHPDVKAISFTGSTRVGGEIARIAAPKFKKLSLEMGGKNPNVIFADCDYDKMLETTIRSSFSNQGQICLCGSRILVEASLYEKFKEDFVKKIKTLKVGYPGNPDSDLGAIVSEVHYQKILQYLDLARAEGGKVLCGGEAVTVPGYENGFYIAPTIIEGLNQECRTNQEEIFGPVVTIMPFNSEGEALSAANATEYGLSSTIWTQDIGKAMRIGKSIQAGIVWVNTWLHRDLRTPFGGIKNSGVGREGGNEALRFFTEAKNVCIQY